MDALETVTPLTEGKTAMVWPLVDPGRLALDVGRNVGRRTAIGCSDPMAQTGNLLINNNHDPLGAGLGRFAKCSRFATVFPSTYSTKIVHLALERT